MFDVLAFLSDHFGNADGVIGLVGKHNAQVPNREAVRKWFAREAVAAEWWPVLQTTLEAEYGQPVSLAKYLSGAKGHDIFS